MPCIWLQHNNKQLFMNVAVLSPEDRAAIESGKLSRRINAFTALVDTGATTTCITPKVAEMVGLEPIGKVPIQGVSGQSFHNNFLFHIGFPLSQTLQGGSSGVVGKAVRNISLTVLDMEIQGAELQLNGDQFNVLLGMDVIGTGSLKLEGNGTASFSF